MKTIGMAIGILIVALLALAIGGGLFALLAYGVGTVLTRLTGLDSLPATAIGMAGMFLFGILVERAFTAFISIPKNLAGVESDEFDEYDFEDEDEEGDYLDVDEDSVLSEQEVDDILAGIPRWRRPLKTLDFSDVKPDDRCPCGSGRKFKNCHGKKTKVV